MGRWLRRMTVGLTLGVRKHGGSLVEARDGVSKGIPAIGFALGIGWYVSSRVGLPRVAAGGAVGAEPGTASRALARPADPGTSRRR